MGAAVLKVFLVAGEPSGDKLGGALMAGLKSLTDAVEFAGVGGPAMESEGLESLFDMNELSVMGIAEVLPKYRHLHRRMRETADCVIASAPDVLVTIDSPDFCLRVAKHVRASAPGIRIVHYVSPTVWAWRPKRAGKMARNVDQVLTLLPFEPPYMQAAGMRADFVGHPVVAERQPTAEEVAAFRDPLGPGPMVLALPGSRRSEVDRLADRFGASLKYVVDAHPDARVVVPAAAHVAGQVEDAIRDWPGNPVLVDPRGLGTAEAEAQKRLAFAAGDVALAASGTVSLELAAAGTPMVIAYDAAWLSRVVVEAMLLVDTVTLVNLVSETREVPEFLTKRCRPELIGPGLLELMSNPEEQRAALEVTMERLGRGGEAPGIRAARAVLDGLER